MRLHPFFSILLCLTACNSNGIEQAFAPDPRLLNPTTVLSPTATPTPAPTPSPQATISPSPTATPSTNPSTSPITNPYSDLDQTPSDLRHYLNDHIQLNTLPLNTCNPSPCKEFQPNQPIQRREYVRWLVSINNRFYQDQPSQQIRLAPPSASPAFSDVPTTDPDFAIIQGLAETGIIPSPLSGEKSTEFRPNASLNREDLIRWKLPIDNRTTLPKATATDIKTAWSFQDTDTISPNALPALLADHNQGENSNLRRVFRYTTLFQPRRDVTRAEAAAILWRIGHPQSRTISDLLPKAPKTQ